MLIIGAAALWFGACSRLRAASVGASVDLLGRTCQCRTFLTAIFKILEFRLLVTMLLNRSICAHFTGRRRVSIRYTTWLPGLRKFSNNKDGSKTWVSDDNTGRGDEKSQSRKAAGGNKSFTYFA